MRTWGSHCTPPPFAHCWIGMSSTFRRARRKSMATCRSSPELNRQKHDTRTETTPTAAKIYRSSMKRNYDTRHLSAVPEIQPGDMILVRKCLQCSKAAFPGPYIVTKTCSQQRTLKTLYYMGPNNTTKMTAIKNIVPYHPRRVEEKGPSVCCVPRVRQKGRQR